MNARMASTTEKSRQSALDFRQTERTESRCMQSRHERVMTRGTLVRKAHVDRAERAFGTRTTPSFEGVAHSTLENPRHSGVRKANAVGRRR
jgi:hypothetical protein